MDIKKSKKPPFTFSQCGIKKGEKIYFKKDAKIFAVVVDEKKILYKNDKQEQITSLSGLAQELLGRKNVRGTSYFTYGGVPLDKLREKNEQ